VLFNYRKNIFLIPQSLTQIWGWSLVETSSLFSLVPSKSLFLVPIFDGVKNNKRLVTCYLIFYIKKIMARRLLFLTPSKNRD